MLEMNPDLMGSTAVQLHPEQVDHIEAGYNAGVGSSQPPASQDGHALPILRMPGNSSLDSSGARLQVPPSESGVAAAYASGSDCGTKAAMA
jgi:hypothetical protein